MKTILAFLLLAGLALSPQHAAAQATITTPAIPAVTLPSVNIPAVPAQRITAGHAMALGVGLFAGAVAGSVLIHGGALAAAIGGAAGLAVGHWAWTEAEYD
ncbi:hypothetical protein HB662_08850 [Roseomonas frigidaquae]|uniref:Uncharacterized protein n=1 Tax=Falsiroseomonas frigidaquae TaxID=487318 RepID=A0ABX1EXU5_9PROT|nr:hypothetical protein [Falsiroseomonas frigidaquae]NKE44885.1 hypothetical protein [Falsiroseomonas frigidaquae]